MDLQQLASMSAFIKQELTPLAEKLGQTAEFTYGIFIKQVWVHAIQSALWIPLGIVCACISIWLFKKEEKEWSKSSSTSGLGYFLGSIVTLGALSMIFVPIAILIQVIINPDYQAIKLIFETIKAIQ